MIRCIPMGSIHRPSDSGRGDTKGVGFFRCVDVQEPLINKIWCLGSDGVTREVHLTAQIYFNAETVGQFLTQYLTENGRIILVIGQIFINRGVKLLGIPADAWGCGFLFIENIECPIVPSSWGDVDTSNQNWLGTIFACLIFPHNLIR